MYSNCTAVMNFICWNVTYPLDKVIHSVQLWPERLGLVGYQSLALAV